MTFLVVLTFVALFVLLGARPVQGVSTYGPVTDAPIAAPSEETWTEGVDAQGASNEVPAPVRAVGIAMLAIGGAAAISRLPRRPQSTDRPMPAAAPWRMRLQV